MKWIQWSQPFNVQKNIIKVFYRIIFWDTSDEKIFMWSSDEKEILFTAAIALIDQKWELCNL